MARAGITGMTKILSQLKGYFAKAAEAVFSINSTLPDANGNVDLPVVPGAQQLVTDEAQTSEATFIARTTGGDASIGDGSAVLMQIRGNSVHTGVIDEELNMSLITAQRAEGVEPITATLNRDTFVSVVNASTTVTLLYTSAWSENPTAYGVTVTGTPMAGDTITIVYVKADRGTISVPTPIGFRSTGYNLYNHLDGCAYVIRYSDEYGFLIAGTYTSLQFSATEDGARTTITPASGYFNVPSNGYVWVTGGNNTDTEIYATWTDWISGRDCAWAAYSESSIDLSTVATYFPYGMCKVGSVYDEIDLNSGLAIQRIERLVYSADTIESLEAAGRAYEADSNYIYAVLSTYLQNSIAVDGVYTACDHGLEVFDGTTVPVTVNVLYGENLVDKLRTDVLTKSSDLVNNLTTNDATKALSAAQGYALNSSLTNLITEELKYAESTTVPANSFATLSFNVTKQGYTPFGVVGYNSFDARVLPVSSFINNANSIGMVVRNISSSDVTGSFGIRVAYKKS